MLKRDEFKLLDRVVFGRAAFNPPFKASSPLENEARFVHVVNGTSRLHAPQDRIDLQMGDNVLMRCENFVNNWMKNEDGAPSEVLIFHLYPEVLKHIYDDQLPDFLTASSSAVVPSAEKIPPNKMVDNFVHGLRFYLDNRAMLTEALLKVKFQELLLILVNTDQSGTVKAMLSDLFNTKAYEFREIIHSNLFEDLKLEDLAFLAGMSLSSFKRKFNTVFGTSPNQYIRTRRLDRAKKLLEQSDQRISEIAYDCGFNDIGYFSKSFSAKFNCSPSDYRKRLVT